MSTTSYRTCPLCEATCGLEITVDDGRVVGIRGDKLDVFSHGFVCPKGATLKHLHEDPDRLRAPLIREGDDFREVSWDEAFAHIQANLPPLLKTHGRDALGLYLGNPNVHTLAGAIYLRPLVKLLGTKNLSSASTVDQMPKHVSCGLLFGHPDLIPVPDIDRTDYLLMLGANPLASNGSLCTAPDFPGRLKAIKARGTLVVVDPRRTRTADLADEHLAIIPGADALFLFAIVNTLLSRGLAHIGRLAEFTSGLETLADLAAPFTAEAVAGATGLSADTIVRIATDLAQAESAVVYGRLGTCTVSFGTLTSWLCDVVNLLTGNLDRAGGAMFPRAAHDPYRTNESAGGRGFVLGRWSSRVRNLAEVRSELPVAGLADEMLTEGPGQIRALLTVAGNPVLSTPNGAKLEAALGQLEFMVSVDIYLNETTRHANVILPPPSALERPHYDLAFYRLSIRNIANFSPATFEPVDGQLDESEILTRLTLILAGQAGVDPAMAETMVITQLVQRELNAKGSPLSGMPLSDVLAAIGERKGAERILDFLLRAGGYGDHFGRTPGGLSLSVLEASSHGVDLGPLQPRLPDALNTPSGQIELTPQPIVAESQRLAESLTASKQNGPMVLIGRRHLRSNNSWMHNLEPLVRGKGRCTLQIHPVDADRLGLANDTMARVISRVGQLEAPIEVTDKIRVGVVSLPHGWGHGRPNARLRVAAQHAGVNTNLLTDEFDLDPLSGTAVLNGIPVTVTGV